MDRIFKADELSHYVTRTFDHISRVQKRAVMLADHYVKRCDTGLFESTRQMFAFLQGVATHDQSKFSPEQWPIYCIMSYKRNVTGEPLTDEENAEFEKSFRNHYLRESHHPEATTKANPSFYWGKQAAIHCACDLQAMADEFGEGSARKYFNDVWWPEYCDIVTMPSKLKLFNVRELMEKCFSVWEDIDSKAERRNDEALQS